MMRIAYNRRKKNNCIPHRYIDEYNNGLTYILESFKDQPMAGHVKLIKGERSQLAQIAADLL